MFRSIQRLNEKRTLLNLSNPYINLPQIKLPSIDNNSKNYVEIQFLDYTERLEEGDPRIAQMQEEAKQQILEAEFLERILASSDAEGVAKAALSLIGDEKLHQLVDYKVTSCLEADDKVTSEQLNSGPLRQLLENSGSGAYVQAYNQKKSDLAWKQEIVDSDPLMNLSQEQKNRLEDQGLNVSLLSRDKDLGNLSQKELNSLIHLLREMKEEKVA